MLDVPNTQVAARLAGALLSPLGDRWTHTKAVAARADELARAVPIEERRLLVVAAWWHDLGYATGLVKSGMHQIDGASFLDDLGYPTRLTALVAHHSAAEREAEERGLLDRLSRWYREESSVADALWMADMTTGPRGERMTYQVRFAEIMSRYRADSAVGRAMTAARPAISLAIERTEGRLQTVGPSPSDGDADC